MRSVVGVVAELVDHLLDELVAEVHTRQARLRRRDGVEDRGVGVVDERTSRFSSSGRLSARPCVSAISTNTIGSFGSAGWKNP